MIKGIPLKVGRVDFRTIRVSMAEMPTLIIEATDEDEADVIEDYWSAIVEHSDMLSEMIDFDLSESQYED